jgi:hypothetical protein
MNHFRFTTKLELPFPKSNCYDSYKGTVVSSGALELTGANGIVDSAYGSATTETWTSKRDDGKIRVRDVIAAVEERFKNNHAEDDTMNSNVYGKSTRYAVMAGDEKTVRMNWVMSYIT